MSLFVVVSRGLLMLVITFSGEASGQHSLSEFWIASRTSEATGVPVSSIIIRSGSVVFNT